MAETQAEHEVVRFASDLIAMDTAHPELFEGCTEAIGESGGFIFHAGPDLRLYPIASAERGTAWLRLTARGTAGHGSKPNGANAVARLATPSQGSRGIAGRCG